MNRRTLAAVPVAAMLALVPVGAARADNAEPLPRTRGAVVTVDLHGNTAGTVTACVDPGAHRIRIVSFRVWDWSRGVRTRMGGGGVSRSRSYCATTGNWFRGMRSSVNVSVVDQVTGAYSSVSVPVSSY